MAVALQAGWTAKTQVSGTGVTSLSHITENVVSGSNRALVAMLVVYGTVTGLAVNWDNAGTPQSMTEVASRADVFNITTKLFGLLAPTIGNGLTLNASWTGAVNAALDPIPFDGVLQTSIATAFTNAAGANATGTPTLSVTTSSGDATVSCVEAESSPLSTPSATQIWNFTGLGGAQGGCYTLSTGTSDSHNWTGPSAIYALCGIRVNQAAGGAAPAVVLNFTKFPKKKLANAKLAGRI